MIVHREAPFVCVVAHESGVSSMDDCLKCQTFTATPAEPGDLNHCCPRADFLNTLELVLAGSGACRRKNAALR